MNCDACPHFLCARGTAPSPEDGFVTDGGALRVPRDKDSKGLLSFITTHVLPGEGTLFSPIPLVRLCQHLPFFLLPILYYFVSYNSPFLYIDRVVQ